MAFLSREQRLVQKIVQWTGSSFIGDDCALMPDERLDLVSCDLLVEGTHFCLDWTDWESLGAKSCAVNLSDIAAMGGRPRFITVGLVLPADISESCLQSFYRGAIETLRPHGVEIVGGDLVLGKSVVISVTVLGESALAPQAAIMRDGAQPGDVVVVTGEFGSSALGLQLLRTGAPRDQSAYLPFFHSHLRPVPRIDEGMHFSLITQGRASLMDASDGLADALCQIARMSNVAIEIDSESLPMHPDLQSISPQLDLEPLELALFGGEDYELVGTMAPEAWQRLQDENAGKMFKEIGRVKAPGSDPSALLGEVCLMQNRKPMMGARAAKLGLSPAGALDLSHGFEHFC